jgi:hypothetical protein
MKSAINGIYVLNLTPLEQNSCLQFKLVISILKKELWFHNKTILAKRVSYFNVFLFYNKVLLLTYIL